MSASSSSGRVRSPLVAAAFLASGFSALVYQVCWQRILALHTGIGLYSVAMIIAAFLAGLGVGSQLGGVLSTRFGRQGALVAFVGLELAVGAMGFFSPRVYYDTLSAHAAWLYSPAWRAGILHFLSLLPPTVLMGMSLPFLVRAQVADTGRAPFIIGNLYAVNTLGAAAGALATPWWLIRFHGVEGALLAGVAGNGLAAALAVLALLTRAPAVGSDGGEAPSRPVLREPLPLWIALYTASGFVALSLEIVWFRIVDVAVKATAFTFGTVLALFLVGVATGSLIGSRIAPRLTRPLAVFLACQCLILIGAGLSVLALAWLPTETPLYDWYLELWRGERNFNLNGPWRSGPIWRLYVLLPAFLYLGPTLLMGFSFPVLQRAVHDDPRTSGRKVGLLQAANIAGNVGGSLVTGLWMLGTLGVTGSLRVLLLAGLGFAFVGVLRGRARRVFGTAAAALLLLALALPGQQRFWLRLHGRDASEALILEDASSVVALIPDGQLWRVWVNGKTHAALPFGGIHTMIGAVPAILHPNPVEVAVVGLASGDTAWAAGCRPETRRLEVFELAGPQLPLLRRLAELDPPAKLPRFLRDRRYRIQQADGRNALERSDRLYDIIAVDGPRPSTAYSGHLYSVQFFELCARRLKRGGILGVWAPSRRIAGGVTRSFAHVLSSPKAGVLFARNEPFDLDPSLWRAQLSRAKVVGYLSPRRAAGVRRAIANIVVPEPVPPGVFNEDLFPRDEFNSPD